MLRITESVRFLGEHNYVFTMNIKSLYTTIPNRDGLLALVFVFVFYFYVILMLKRFASKQGHRQPRIHSNARVLRPCLHGVGDPGLVG